MKLTERSRKLRLWLLVGVGLVAILAWVHPWGPHKQIAPSSVSAVRFVSPGKDRTLPPGEAAQVIGWFNQIRGERNNSAHAGPGCGAPDHLEIALTSGEQILIWGGDRVNRYPAGERTADYVDYYFEHPQLAAYIKGLSAKGGC